MVDLWFYFAGIFVGYCLFDGCFCRFCVVLLPYWVFNL